MLNDTITENTLPDQDTLYKELKIVIKTCLSQIKNRIMQQLVNCWLNGLKRKDMANLLDVSIGYVNGCLERGKSKFRNCIRENYSII